MKSVLLIKAVILSAKDLKKLLWAVKGK